LALRCSPLRKYDSALWEGRDEVSIAAHADLDGGSTEALGSLNGLPLGPTEAARGEPGGMRLDGLSGREGLGGEHVGERGEVLDDLRGEVFEEGEEVAADADAREAGVEVARVAGEGEAMAFDVGGDVRAARAEEGADQLDGGLGRRGGSGLSGRLGRQGGSGAGLAGIGEAGLGRVEERGERWERRARRQDGETPGPSAAEEAQEEGLGPVVGGVARGDGSSARGGGSAEEGGEASGPSPSLQV
jgi:hypothetical protein